MKRVEVEVFSDDINRWIVRSPGRRFPALAIQGDSFNELRRLAREIARRAASKHDEDLSGAANDLLANLEERIQYYEAVLSEHGIELPYPSS